MTSPRQQTDAQLAASRSEILTTKEVTRDVETMCGYPLPPGVRRKIEGILYSHIALADRLAEAEKSSSVNQDRIIYQDSVFRQRESDYLQQLAAAQATIANLEASLALVARLNLIRASPDQEAAGER